jgi:hypothetical protein
MKLSKFLSVALFMTIFCVLYVWQQTEIVRLAYAGQKKQVEFQELLDNNSQLRYNIEKSSSLVELGPSLSGRSDFSMPERYQIVRLAPKPANPASGARETIFARIFSVKRQAEAKTVNP